MMLIALLACLATCSVSLTEREEAVRSAQWMVSKWVWVKRWVLREVVVPRPGLGWWWWCVEAGGDGSGGT